MGRQTDPLVSVVIPAYNASAFVAETIECVLGLDWPHLEVIVVDDGSTDTTPEVVKRWGSNSRVKYSRQENRGASAARNFGLTQAQGDYVQFLDADDLLSSDKIRAQVRVLQEAGPKSVASCAWGKFSGSPEAVRISLEPVWREEDPLSWLTRSLSGGGMMQTSCWLAPRSILEAAGPWNESLSLHDDGEYFCRVLLVSDRQIFVDGPLVYYRTVENSLSRKRGRRAIESAFEVCTQRDRHLLARADDANVRRAIATQYAQFAYEFSRDASDLAAKAVERVREMDVEPADCIGGGTFSQLSRWGGWKLAYRLRSMTSPLREVSRHLHKRSKAAVKHE